MAQDAQATQYGPRKLGKEAYAAQQERQKRTSRDGTTVYGSRKAGAKRPEYHELKKEKELEEKGGAIAWDELSIGKLEATLEAQPGLLDVATEAELERTGGARKGAAEVLLRFEKERPGGQRETMVNVLTQIIG